MSPWQKSQKKSSPGRDEFYFRESKQDKGNIGILTSLLMLIEYFYFSPDCYVYFQKVGRWYFVFDIVAQFEEEKGQLWHNQVSSIVPMRTQSNVDDDFDNDDDNDNNLANDYLNDHYLSDLDDDDE